jgi:hypothetical protein
MELAWTYNPPKAVYFNLKTESICKLKLKTG